MKKTVTAPGPSISSRTENVFFILFCTAYGFLLWVFASIDLYRSGFDEVGGIVFVYNALRLAFVSYLFWILYATGDTLLAALSGVGYGEKPTLERLALGFFAGAGVWHVLLLALGLANLLNREMAISLTFTALVFSRRTFATTFFCLPEPGLPSLNNDSDWTRVTTKAFLWGALAISACLLIAVKGLYPAGGHDYFTHYFHYYREVIESGGVWPNNIWYHFYYSKGAGLFFLGMLLTDPLAPQLVTLCMVAGASICLVVFMEHLGVTREWTVAFLTLFLAAYIYTPGPHENMVHGGWGDFEKLHEPQTMLAAFLIYAFYRLMSHGGIHREAYRISAMLAITAAVIVTPPIAVFYVLVSLLLCGIAWARGMRSNASEIASVLFICLATTASLLALNYLATGFVSDQGMMFFWKYADFEKIVQWGVLPNFLVVNYNLRNMIDGEIPLISYSALRFIATSFRFDLFGVALLLCMSWFARKWLLRREVMASGRQRREAAVAVLLSFFIVGCLVTLAFGRTQSISFYRFSSFLIPITVLLTAAMQAYTLSCPTSQRKFGRSGAMPVFMVLLSVVVAIGGLYDRSKLADIVKNAGLFLVGGHSIGSAYANQVSWPGRFSWGGIYPAARISQGIVPPGERLWSLNIHSYCMAPGCRIETYQSYKLGADWYQAFFGTPVQARQSLRAAGLNFFLISTDLSIPDPLALSPLFHPDSIAGHFRVSWTDGEAALLTWKDSKNTAELSVAWLESYRKQVAQSRLNESFPYPKFESVLSNLEKGGDYNRVRTLRWDRESQYMLEPDSGR